MLKHVDAEGNLSESGILRMVKGGSKAPKPKDGPRSHAVTNLRSAARSDGESFLQTAQKRWNVESMERQFS